MARLFNDAIPQYLTIDQVPVASTPLSMGGWGYSDDIASNQTAIFMGDKGAADKWYGLRFRGDIVNEPVNLFRRNAGAGGDNLYSTTSYTANTWHHLCAVCSADNAAAIYLDGGGKNTSVVNHAPANWDRTSIGGARDSTPDYYMSGRLAEVGIWNVALTDAEVLVLAHGVRPIFVRPANLVFYLPLIRDDDQDLVGALSLNAVGNPTIAAHAPMYYTASGLVAPVSGISIPVFSMHYFRKRRSKN